MLGNQGIMSERDELILEVSEFAVKQPGVATMAPWTVGLVLNTLRTVAKSKPCAVKRALGIESSRRVGPWWIASSMITCVLVIFFFDSGMQEHRAILASQAVFFGLFTIKLMLPEADRS